MTERATPPSTGGILVYVLHHAGAFNPNSLGALAEGARLAQALGTTCDAFLLGPADTLPDGLCASLGAHGAARVYRAEGPEGLAQPAVDAGAAAVAAGGHDYALFGGGLLGFEIGAGLAARLDAGVCMEVVSVGVEDGQLVAERPILGDTQLSKVRFRSAFGVLVGRLNAFAVRETPGRSAPVEDLVVDFAPHSLRARIVARADQRGADVRIEDADIVVAGGRGLGRAEGFAQLEALAEAVGGTVAATRAVVDAGWAAYSSQIGQTGKTISPRLYLAAGISGAIQHKVGMQASEHIVAINKDANAPIFDFADLGVVGDLNQIVPRLTEAVRARRGS